MRAQRADGWTRRRFLGGLTLAGTAGLLGLRARPSAAEPPPETTTLRLIEIGASCVAPQYIAEELLKAEGFTDVRYLGGVDPWRALASGTFDIASPFLPTTLGLIDTGAPVVFLAGGHIGCIELFAQHSIRSLRDLKGKIVGVVAKHPLSPDYNFISCFAAWVGLDPRRDLQWLEPAPSAGHTAEQRETQDTNQAMMRLLAEGRIDAFILGPPAAQEFRAQQMGHVLVNVALDRPWSQYFCCMVAGSREFIRRHPIATKRALRALLKANQICALEPDRVAQFMVDKGYDFARPTSYKYIVQGLQELPYGAWREYDAEDAVRFYALRLHEVGMIKSTPQKLIAQATDWRFLNELKRELKG
jgi:NitT/TauT family transport system substrate-binding protein